MRDLYRTLVPYETRYWLYKLRHQAEFRGLRTEVNSHAKGDFSLRRFDASQCIFVHITKSAGTSVAMSLFGELPYHYTAVEYRVIFGRRDFNRYFKFAFARNPWDRLYSAYTYLKAGGWDQNDAAWASANLGAIGSFEDFVMTWLSPERLFSHIHLWPQRHFLCDGLGRVLIDDLGYFETLAEDFERIRSRVNAAALLPHMNRSPRDDYRSVYTPRAVDKVGCLYADDIVMLGYSFEGVERRQVRAGRLIPAPS
jgi:hypothetical protein